MFARLSASGSKVVAPLSDPETRPNRNETESDAELFRAEIFKFAQKAFRYFFVAVHGLRSGVLQFLTSARVPLCCAL